jgi:soluble lytic murein transglycosylase-like protein
MRCMAGCIALLVVAVVSTLAAGADLGPTADAVDQRALFRIVGYMHDVDPDLLQAIAAIESGGDSNAVSPAGAQGLMQLMPGTARRFGVENPFDTVDNVFGAVRYLDHLRRWEAGRRGHDMSLIDVLAAYNAGERAVEKYGGIPPYAETQEYVHRVMLAYLLIGLMRQPAHGPAGLTAAIPQIRGQVRARPLFRAIKPAESSTHVKSAPMAEVFNQLAAIRKARALAISRQSASDAVEFGEIETR